jgi:hypothetical protein
MKYATNQVPAAPWYERAASAMVRNDYNLFRFVNENNLNLTSTECQNILRTKAFQDVLRVERNRFYKELSTDPSRSRNTAIGQLLFAITKLLDGEQYDKAVTAIAQLFKAEGWTSDQAQFNIFNDLNAKDIEGLKKHLADKLEKK